MRGEMEFRIATHTVTGKPMVEVWQGGEFIAVLPKVKIPYAEVEAMMKKEAVATS